MTGSTGTALKQTSTPLLPSQLDIAGICTVLSGKIVYFDRSHQDCLHGAYITGVHEGTEQIRIDSIIVL